MNVIYVFLVGLLDSGGLKVLKDHFRKRLFFSVGDAALRRRIDQFVVFVDTKHTMWRKALDGKRPGYADFLFVVVGFVVEEFELRLRCNGRIDLLLARNTDLPPVGVQLLGGHGPGAVRFTRYLPFQPCLRQRGT